MTDKTLFRSAKLFAMPLAIACLLFTGCQREGAIEEVSEGTIPPGTGGEGTTFSAEDRARVDALVQPYLEVHQLLVDDKFEGTAEKFAAIGEAAQPLTDSRDAAVKGLAMSITEDAQQEPEDLEAARKIFGGISLALADLVRIIPPTGAVGDTLYVAYSPEAELTWLQTAEELKNPYADPAAGDAEVELKETIPLE